MESEHIGKAKRNSPLTIVYRDNKKNEQKQLKSLSLAPFSVEKAVRTLIELLLEKWE